MFVLCAIFAIAFLLQTVLTITNSFMSEEEINANYGMIFSTTTGGYVSKTVNLKFIPDKVTLSQYINGLIKSPEYLLKFWNSVRWSCRSSYFRWPSPPSRHTASRDGAARSEAAFSSSMSF